MGCAMRAVWESGFWPNGLSSTATYTCRDSDLGKTLVCFSRVGRRVFWRRSPLTLAPCPPIQPPTSNPSGMALSSRNLANVLMDMGFHIRETAARQDPILRSIAVRPFLVCGMARRD